MIKSFRHKGLENLFLTNKPRGLDAQLAPKLLRMLKVLNDSTEPAGMNVPGHRLHLLRGDRKGQWAVWVSGNWRLVFVFDGPNAADVDLVDYH